MKKPKPVAVRGTVRVNAYVVIARAVEEGVACGWRRAHKHTDSPGEEAILEHIEREVMGALCEALNFDDQAGEVSP